MGLSPFASDVTRRFLLSLVKFLTDNRGGRQRHGVAPKNQIELRVETLLRKMNVWRKPDDE